LKKERVYEYLTRKNRNIKTIKINN